MLLLYLFLQISFLLRSHLQPRSYSAISVSWLPFLNGILDMHHVSTHGSTEEAGVGRDASGILEWLFQAGQLCPFLNGCDVLMTV